MSVFVSADDDAALVERCVRGDTTAFRPLVERYQRVLFTVALRMLGDYADASDAAQNAFIHAYQKLDTWDRSHKFFSWLYRILVNECLNARRSRRRFEPLEPTLAAGDNQHQAVEESEVRATVQAALARLPRPQREVVILRHFADLSYQEMADALGIPEKTVKSRLYSARQRLGELLLGWNGER